MKLGISKGYNNFLHIMRKQRVSERARENEKRMRGGDEGRLK